MALHLNTAFSPQSQAQGQIKPLSALQQHIENAHVAVQSMAQTFGQMKAVKALEARCEALKDITVEANQVVAKLEKNAANGAQRIADLKAKYLKKPAAPTN